jgi:hypothetical protein
VSFEKTGGLERVSWLTSVAGAVTGPKGIMSRVKSQAIPLRDPFPKRAPGSVKTIRPAVPQIKPLLDPILPTPDSELLFDGFLLAFYKDGFIFEIGTL